MASVGQELLDVPLPDIVAKLAFGIAAAQRALDDNSLNTAIELAKTKIDVVPLITETIADDGTVTIKEADAIKMSLIQVGLFPTLYQFAEASIEVEMDIKTTTSTETNVKVHVEAKVGFACWSASVRAEVSHNRKFQKEVHGTSKLMTRMVPVPPPPRLFPQIQTVDLRKPAPSAPYEPPHSPAPVSVALRGFRSPIVAPTRKFPETANVSFGDLVRMLAQGIADAQTSLDHASAEMAVELGSTMINIVPTITETIAADGSFTFTPGAPQTVSLLEIGLTPTFYQFSEATVDVAMDVHLVESEDEQTKEKRSGLFVSTREVTLDRKLNRDTTSSTRMTAKLVPVPSPLLIDPVRRTIVLGS